MTPPLPPPSPPAPPSGGAGGPPPVGRCVGALRLALALVALAAAAHGVRKLAEPGGGLAAHASYVARAALLPARCATLPSAPLGPPRELSACLTFRGDTRRDLLEWLAFRTANTRVLLDTNNASGALRAAGRSTTRLAERAFCVPFLQRRH